MHEMVEQLHAHLWAFAERAQLDIDPVALKRSIGQQVSGALLVVSPEALERIGHARLAVMLDVATRYELTLAELLMEALDAGADNSASLCRDLKGRQGRTRQGAKAPHLHVIK